MMNQDQLLKLACMKKNLNKVVNYKENIMSSKCFIQLPNQTTLEIMEKDAVLLQGRGDSFIFVVDLYLAAKENIGVKFGSGLLRK